MKTTVTIAALAGGVATAAMAAMSGEMTIVSWGGAYSASQQNAYHAPYMAMNPGVTMGWR